MTQIGSEEIELRLQLLRRVIVVVFGILVLNFVLGLLRKSTLGILICEGLSITALVFAYFKTRQGVYDLSAALLISASYVFVVAVRFFDGYTGEYLISQTALALCIIFFMAAVFFRTRSLVIFSAILVCLSYFMILTSFILSGALGPNAAFYLSKITTPIILLPAIVILGVAIWSIFERTSKAMSAYVGQIETGKTALAKLNSHLEEQVHERSLQLIEKSRHEVLDAMVAGLSHQLNTPLGSATTMATFIKLRLAQSANLEAEKTRVLDAVDLIERNLLRAVDLITSYRQLGSFSVEEPAIYSTVGPFFTHVKNNVESLLQGEAIEVVYDYDPLLAIQAPLSQLHYVVIELVQNARIHGDQSGLKILIQCQMNEGSLDLRVYNSGKSVSASVRSRALDPFFTTAGSEGRLGLGLAKVQTIVKDRLGGSVRLLEPDGSWAFVVSVIIPGARRST